MARPFAKRLDRLPFLHRIILTSLAPTVLLGAVVILLVVYGFQKTSLDLIERRSAALVQVAASCLSTDLQAYSRNLEAAARALDDAAGSVEGQGAVLRYLSDFLLPFDGGVIVYDFENKSYSIIPSGEKLSSVALHEEKVYVGGANLYTINDSTLEKVDEEFEGVVTNLFSYGYRLMVGTECGLYSTGIFGHELLFDGITVSAITADEDGLWIGTQGEGLYRWDGERFRKRFLLRDSTLFDFVNSLAYNHQHLYVGTDKGLHIFDGGRWENLSAADGLPSDFVRDIDASQWVVYIATDAGVTSYFNGDFMPVDKLEDKNVSVVSVRKGRIIAGTDRDGILYKTNNILKTLVEPFEEPKESMISAIE